MSNLQTKMKKKMFKLGFIINPIAGIGGSVALKGSDDMAQHALALGAKPKANARAQTALKVLLPYQDEIMIYTANNQMGEQAAKDLANLTVDTLPDEIEHWHHLEELDLSYNKLTELPPSIGNLHNLRRLDLTYNPIEFIPKEIQHLSKLLITL